MIALVFILALGSATLVANGYGAFVASALIKAGMITALVWWVLVVIPHLVDQLAVRR